MTDLRYAARALVRTPLFSTAVVLSLGVGLGVALSLVAVVNAYLIRSLPYPESSRLYQVIYADSGTPEPGGLSSFNWATAGDVVELAMTHSGGNLYLTDDGFMTSADAAYVTPGFVEGLGIRAAMGRSFAAGDYLPGAERVALIGQGFWRDRFGSDPDIVGRRFRAYSNRPEDVAAYTIVGVLPPDFWTGFRFGRSPEVFVPAPPGLRTYMVRLRKGVPPADAALKLTSLMKSHAPAVPAAWQLRLRSVHDQYVAEARPLLQATIAAAAIVLLIVCANVGVLTLLRAARRQHDVAVRLAIGASWRDVGRLLVAESGLICAAALALGVALAWLTLDVVAPLVEQQLGRPAPGGSAAIAIDTTVLAIVAAASVLMTAALSLVPLLVLRRQGLDRALRQGARAGTGGRARSRVRSVLIAVEVAGSLALLVGCGLMLRTVAHLTRIDLGYDIAPIVRSRLVLPARAYPDAAAQADFYQRALDRFAATPGIRGAALSSWPAFYEPPPTPVEDDAGAASDAVATSVSDGYFSALGIPVLQGRPFDRSDRVGGEPVAIVSDALARRLWPGGSALGRRIRASDPTAAGNPPLMWRTVVGVAADVRQTFVDENPRDVYLPRLAAPSRFAGVYLRVDNAHAAWLPSLRAVIGGIDPAVLVEGAVPISRTADQQLAGPRFLASMLTGFALFTGILVVLGVYGVVAYAAEQREREVAIRSALGATPGAVIRLFLKDAGLVIGIGLASGLLGAAGVARLLERQIHGITPFDVPTLVLMAALLATASLVAIWWPARRAAHANPVEALRH